MFLLRIAEALVTSEEFYLNSVDASKNEQDESSINVNGLIEAIPLPSKNPSTPPHSPDNTSNVPMSEDNDKLSSNFQNPVENSAPSPGLMNNLSIHSFTSMVPSPFGQAASPMSMNTDEFNDQPKLQQSHQGLLYSLLIAKESNDDGKKDKPVTNGRSPSTTLRSGHDCWTKCSNTDSATENFDKISEDQSTCDSLSTIYTSFKHSKPVPRTVSDSENHGTTVSKSSSSSVNFRNRANSLGCKLTNNRPYIRPHASTISAASDFYPSLKSRLQLRRQTGTLTPEGSFSRPKGILHTRTFAKSHEISINNTKFIDSRSCSLSSVVSQTSSLSSGISSPRVHQQSLSAQARLMVTDSQASSGFCSAGLHQSPLASSMSTDSGSEEPIDLTGYNLTMSSIHPTHASLKSKAIVTNGCSKNLFVQLAKKTAHPVQARVTEWLKQAAEFVAQSTPLVSMLKPNLISSYGFGKRKNTMVDINYMDSWFPLLSQCWHRLLVLSMVEHALDLVVVEDKSSHESIQIDHLDNKKLCIPWSLLPAVQHHGLQAAFDKEKRPDRKFANELLQFLSELRQAGLTSQEFYLLRHVVLLTVDEPDAIPELGLNVIRASRHMGPETEPSIAVANLLKFESGPHSAKDDFPTTVTFDLACLLCGLKALKSMCPYRIANLFCTHLQSSSALNSNFIFDLHMRYLASLRDVKAMSTAQSILEAETKKVPAPNPIQNGKSILEQLFDSF